MQIPNYDKIIAMELGLNEFQVVNVLKLTLEGSTVPFIARYRKEMTQDLNESQLRNIIELKESLTKLYDAKMTALINIKKQDKLTPELQKNIENAKTLKEVEAIYKPYKLKKKTKAMIAKEKGFQVIANQIRNHEAISIPEKLLKEFNEEEIIEGAIDIVAQDVTDDTHLRELTRESYHQDGEVVSKIKSNIDKLPEHVQKQVYKFDIYKKFEKPLQYLKNYQVLALNRGENLGILSIKGTVTETAYEKVETQIVDADSNGEEYLKQACQQGFKNLSKSVENEVWNESTEIAELDAMETFRENLTNLLMIKPQYGKTVLAIDPGFRTGCKIAMLDKHGNPIAFNKIFLHQESSAISTLKKLIDTYGSEIIVIGNGTASNETVELIQNNFEIEIVVVNESGASVYSASEAGSEDFPDLDPTDRGTISIGRRFIDPLAELVKIPPHNIGVGMYQHDMNQKLLEQKLTYSVEDVVNQVGINVNTASVHLLKYISGLDKRSAKKIVKNAPYTSRVGLKKVLTEKAYEQAIGFLRIPESKEPLDNTNIHPEQYSLANYVLEVGENVDLAGKDFDNHVLEMKQHYSLVQKQTIQFIIEAYDNMGNDPRINTGNLTVHKKRELEDIKENEILEGVIRNVVQFGAFVDVGVKNDGLVHISELANRFVSNPMEVVKVGEKVKVKVVKIDLVNKKLQLSIKQACS